MLCEMLRNVFIWIENGMFISAVLVETIMILAGSEVMSRFVFLMTFSLQPILRKQEKMTREMFWRGRIQRPINVITIIVGILAATFVRINDQEYNAFHYMFVEVTCIQAWAFALTGVIYVSKLIHTLKTITTDQENNFQKNFIKRNLRLLNISRFLFINIFFTYGILTQLQVFLYVGLGSVPYEFIFFILLCENFFFPESINCLIPVNPPCKCWVLRNICGTVDSPCDKRTIPSRAIE